MQLMIFSCQWSRFFSYDKFDLINFLFNCFLKFKICCFSFVTDSVVETHISNPLFKVCGKYRNMIHVVNKF